jgi:hypothetical protein
MPEAFAAIMASHIEICPACREDLAWLEHIGGALLESLPPAPVSGPAPVIAMRAGEAGDDQDNVDVTQPGGNVPSALVQAVGRDLDSINWTEVSPGVWEHEIALKTRDRGHLRLTKVAPKQTFPEHRHRSSIIALVLKGSFRGPLATTSLGTSPTSAKRPSTRRLPILTTAAYASSQPLSAARLKPRMRRATAAGPSLIDASLPSQRGKSPPDFCQFGIIPHAAGPHMG